MDIKTCYEFILAQFSAESYWDNLYGSEPFDINNPVQFRDRLLNGANRYDVIAQLELEDKLGPTRMTSQMADDFENTWQIITHLPNQISGFSATLLQHKTTGEFTLSFRGTEPKDENDGGDRQRDVFGADAEITFDGFSFAQIQDMEEFYKQIKNGYAYNESTQGFEADASLNEFKDFMAGNGKLNLTGYSLSGAGDDTALGGSGNDAINAQAGDDYVYGGDDNDLIFSEAGFDVLQGGYQLHVAWQARMTGV